MDNNLRRMEYKRFRRKIASKIKKKRKNGGIPSNSTLVRYRLKKVKEGYIERREWKTARKTRTLKVPRNFSFRNDHNSVMVFLSELDEIMKSKTACNLKFSHEATESIGLVASFHLYSKLKTYEEHWRRKKIIISYSGKFSNHKSVNNFMLSFGLLKELGVKCPDNSESFDPDYLDKYFTYKRSGKRQRQSDKSVASAGLADYFAKCLRHLNREVSEEALATLTGAFGELIANVEEHSNTLERKWDVLGCFDKETRECKFAIQNIGISIYKNLYVYRKNPIENVSEIIEAMSLNRRMKRIKDNLARVLGAPSDEKELYWCLLAFQDGISSAETGPGDAPRGQGLMDVLEFMDEIRDRHAECEIVIISGRAKLILDFTYEVKKIERDDTISQ